MSEIKSQEELEAIKLMLAALSEPFSQSAIKCRKGPGGKTFSYVETHTVIHRLNDVAGVWDWEIKDVTWAGEVMIVVGRLTIPLLGARCGTGVQKITEGGGEDLFKGAQSDALKNAAKLFGVAIQLYGPDYEDEGNHGVAAAPAARPAAARPAPTRPAPAKAADVPVGSDQDRIRLGIDAARARGEKTFVDPVTGFEHGVPTLPPKAQAPPAPSGNEEQAEIERILSGAFGCETPEESKAKLWDIIEESQGSVYTAEQRAKWPKASNALKLLLTYMSDVMGGEEEVIA
jgi:hypothetical protein